MIAAYGDQVVMEETLAEALAVLFKPHDGRKKVGNVFTPATTGKEAINHYYRAMERLKLGDWAGFGGELDQLRERCLRATGSRDEPGGCHRYRA